MERPPESLLWRGFYKYAGDLMLGHASLQIRNGQKIMRSYGYWPDDNMIINHGDDRVLKRLEVKKLGDKASKTLRQSSCYPISMADIEKIEGLARSYTLKKGHWNYANNCVRFAAHVFKKITGVNMDTNLPIPLALYKAIEHRNAVRQARKSGVQPPEPPKNLFHNGVNATEESEHISQ